MNIEKVQQLRDFLANLKPHQEFTHLTWSAVYDFRSEEQPDPNTCGTAACICGWLAISEGDAKLERGPYSGVWSWELPNNGDWFIYGAEKLEISSDDTHAVFAPNYHEDASDDAVEMWPYLNEESYFNLFESGALDLDNTTVEHAIAFLDKMISEKRVDIRWWAEIKKDVL